MLQIYNIGCLVLRVSKSHTLWLRRIKKKSSMESNGKKLYMKTKQK